MWRRKRGPLEVSDARVEKRARRLSGTELMEASHNCMTEVSKSLRGGDYQNAVRYSEILLLINREMESRASGR